VAFEEGFEGGKGSGLETNLGSVSGTQNKRRESTKTGNADEILIKVKLRSDWVKLRSDVSKCQCIGKK